MKIRWQALSITLFVLLMLLPKFILVPAVVKYLEAELSREFATNKVEVQLFTGGYRLLAGKLPRFRAVLEDVPTEHLQLAKVEIWGENLKFKPASLLFKGELIYEETPDLKGEILVLEKDLNQFFWKEIDKTRSLKLHLEAGKIVLVGQLLLWNQELSLQLEGDLEVVEGSSIRFVPQNFAFRETRVPPILLELINDNYRFVFDLDIFQFPIMVRELLLLEGEILIGIGGVE